MAFIPAFSGDARRAEEARDKIRAARQFARRGPASPEMLAWLDAVEAETETRFGDTRKALQLIRHAEDIYATEEPRPSPAWLDWFSPVRLAGFKGNTLLTDRQPGRQGNPARVLDHLPEDAAKQRSVILGDLAAVAVSENPEEACPARGTGPRPAGPDLVRNRNGARTRRPRVTIAMGITALRAPAGRTPLRLEHDHQRADRLTSATIPGNSARVVIRQSATSGMSGCRSQM